jgi:hypothetical protein
MARCISACRAASSSSHNGSDRWYQAVSSSSSWPVSNDRLAQQADRAIR